MQAEADEVRPPANSLAAGRGRRNAAASSARAASPARSGSPCAEDRASDSTFRDVSEVDAKEAEQAEEDAESESDSGASEVAGQPALTRAEVDSLGARELKRQLAQRGLSTGGKKGHLAARLEGWCDKARRAEAARLQGDEPEGRNSAPDNRLEVESRPPAAPARRRPCPPAGARARPPYSTVCGRRRRRGRRIKTPCVSEPHRHDTPRLWTWCEMCPKIIFPTPVDPQKNGRGGSGGRR